MTLPTDARSAGFTMIELVMVLLLIGILSAVTIEVMSDTENEAKFQTTINRMKQIQNAMIGDPSIRRGNVRTDFGYLGDVGGLPSTAQGIAALIARPAGVAAYALDDATRIGVGWNGPYLSVAGPDTTIYTKDAWGTNFVYTAGATATLVSYGANRVAGGTGYDQDITISFPPSLRVASVGGFVCHGGGIPLGDEDVDINFPDGTGNLDSSGVTARDSNNGRFVFTNIPFGVRSLEVYGKIIVITVDKPNVIVPCNQIDDAP